MARRSIRREIHNESKIDNEKKDVHMDLVEKEEKVEEKVLDLPAQMPEINDREETVKIEVFVDEVLEAVEKKEEEPSEPVSVEEVVEEVPSEEVSEKKKVSKKGRTKAKKEDD